MWHIVERGWRHVRNDLPTSVVTLLRWSPEGTKDADALEGVVGEPVVASGTTGRVSVACNEAAVETCGNDLPLLPGKVLRIGTAE